MAGRMAGDSDGQSSAAEGEWGGGQGKETPKDRDPESGQRNRGKEVARS